MPRPDQEGDEDGEDDSPDDDEPDQGRFDGEGYQRASDAPRTELWLGVLPQNETIVQVFGRCRIDVAVGMGAYWQGISAREAHAACVISRVPCKDWPRITDGVQLMGQVTANVRNAAEAAKSKGGR
ncbi:MAG TPA: hypothetical protein VFN09_11465 [Rhodanobacteraceae bacterium]|nr:hypothetical protein [Rhodanobacteraceae bacterium]